MSEQLPLSEAVEQLREEMKSEARALSKQLEALGRDIDALRSRICSSLAAWERQASEFTKLRTTAQATAGSSREQPPPSGQGGPPASPQSDASSGKTRDDAARYARLLVSEIELYNREQVAQGRANRDLYFRLKSAIERSRRAYESRFSRAMTAPEDYFHEELVRTLACNDSSLLGANFPAPPE
ncbi:MAG: hypothetical protein ACRD4Q_11530 [Candidatus Acidiferrales bacterium]